MSTIESGTGNNAGVASGVTIETVVDSHHLESDADQQILIPSAFRRNLAAFGRAALHGVGFVCDSFDLYIINLLIVIMQYPEGVETSVDRTSIAVSATIGVVLGQLSFGVVGDYFGRRRAFIFTICLFTFGAAMSSVSWSSPDFDVYTNLSLWRFLMGYGIGGEYPLSACVSAETAVDQGSRGRRSASVKSMGGLGLVAGPCVVLIVLNLVPTTRLDIVWRLTLAIGALPGLLMIYHRWKMPETPSFKAASDNGISKFQQMRQFARPLLAGATSWFLYDSVYVPHLMFSGQILKQWTHEPKPGTLEAQDPANTHAYIMQLSEYTLITTLLGLPGFYVSMKVIDVIGRKKLQMTGFGGMTICFVLIGAFIHQLRNLKGLFFFLYGFSFFFANMGPYVTTYVIPSESFPTSIRATAHGICSAVGRIGAVVGSAALQPLLAATNLETVMYVCGGLSLFGVVWTYTMVDETMHVSILGHQPLINETTMDYVAEPSITTTQSDQSVRPSKHSVELGQR